MSGINGILQRYVMPAAQTITGAAETALGAPQVGIPTIAGGVQSGISANTGGGPASPPTGSMPNSTSIADLGGALGKNPALQGVTPNMVGGVSGPVGTPQQNQFTPPTNTAPDPPATDPPPPSMGARNSASWAGAGDVGQLYMQYLLERKLKRTPDPTAYAAPHSSAAGGMPQFSLTPPTGIQPPQL